jgi:hypothetical protein
MVPKNVPPLSQVSISISTYTQSDGASARQWQEVHYTTGILALHMHKLLHACTLRTEVASERPSHSQAGVSTQACAVTYDAPLKEAQHHH